jgi:hypothetical protein
MTAQKLRVMLIAALFVMLAIIIAVFYLGRQQLSVIAVSVNHANADANASNDNLNTLKKIQDTLTQNQTVISRASQLDATSNGYDYQNKIISDLETYGRQTGVGVTQVDFSAAFAAAGSSAPASPATPAGAGQTPSASASATDMSKPITISVTLDSPATYTSLLKFINLIEQNLPKMQIARLNLSHFDSDPSKVTVSNFAIEMYVK